MEAGWGTSLRWGFWIPEGACHYLIGHSDKCVTVDSDNSSAFSLGIIFKHSLGIILNLLHAVLGLAIVDTWSSLAPSSVIYQNMFFWIQ